MPAESETNLDRLTSPATHVPESLNLLSLLPSEPPILPPVTKTIQVDAASHLQHYTYANIEAHLGSYYHKIYSPIGAWTGIEGTVKLGQPHLDPNRVHHGVAQDSFSTYLGGQAKQEIDAGLSWEVTRDKHGKIDNVHKAWRPFWRNSHWHNGPAESKFYWHSGDTVSMSLHVVSPNVLRLTISDLGEQPKRRFSTDFSAKGFGENQQTFFKRVDSIDQNGTEGKHVRHSASRIEGTVWNNTELSVKSGPSQPMMPGFQRVIDAPPNHVHVSSTHQQRLQGGEEVSIDASNNRSRP